MLDLALPYHGLSIVVQLLLLLHKYARKAIFDLTIPHHALSIVQLYLLHKYARKAISDLTWEDLPEAGTTGSRR
jgi:hypothetical protein